MNVEVKLACLRDASFVLGNLNAEDRAEVMCQLPAGMLPQELAASHLRTKCFVAYLDDVPAMFFGVGALNAACATVWAVGTDKARRVVPEVTRFWHSDLVPWMIENGFRFAEARSLSTNKRAHRWMRNLGAFPYGPPTPFGTADEPFQLFRFTVSSYRSIHGQPGSESV